MTRSQGVLCAASSVAVKAKRMRAVILLATGAAQTELRGNEVQVGKGLSLGSCRKLLPQPACRECHVCVPVPSLQVAPCSTICCIRSISRAPQVS